MSWLVVFISYLSPVVLLLVLLAMDNVNGKPSSEPVRSVGTRADGRSRRHRVTRLAVAGTLVLLTGCQTGNGPLPSSTFMSLWSTYDHCQSSVDVDTMRGDVRRLHDAAQTPLTRQHDPIRPVLRPIERWITPSEPRLAADPKAMAVACTLHTGHTALTLGRSDLAAEMFISVIRSYPQTPYAYYVEQAWWGLIQLNRVERDTWAENVRTTPQVSASEADDREWSMVLVELGPGAVDARHFHPGIELVYVLEGSGLLEVEGSPSVALNPGMVAALPQNRTHVLKNANSTGTLKILVVFFREKGEKRFALQKDPALGDAWTLPS